MSFLGLNRKIISVVSKMFSDPTSEIYKDIKKGLEQLENETDDNQNSSDNTDPKNNVDDDLDDNTDPKNNVDDDLDDDVDDEL